ncbi:nuclease-related domain-containing protein [Schinkia azotoformans]|uniref:nuclease-related domain-containing protein n=1 Tax=Schinkia azotoformans TaxID=1454 RepID=UPI002DBA89F9|nr:nuclease-related domain-containing protein [Schinkia azotoformans]MEC1720367.1 nuclease-related domain-containing protein [Schinkia azotoformans]MED4413370.1 nuclease-related domain-containing protein [Schinkia azotoformans]
MKFIKPRFVSDELKLLRFLYSRMEFPIDDLRRYENLEKGFKGEQQFDIWSEDILIDGLLLNDLLFEVNNTVFQIDSTLISQGTLFQFEVKNFEGDYYLEGDKWLTLSGSTIRNPLHQLERSEILLKQLLQNNGYNMHIESYLIFINPNFHLYHAPINQSIIFPSQLSRFLDKLNRTPSKLNGKHSKLAETLVSKQTFQSPYKRLPNYEYDQLEKGIYCPHCRTFVDVTLKCKCGFEEAPSAAILRSIEEFRWLFPDEKITTNRIYEWCKGNKSIRTIRRILANNFEYEGYGKPGHYIVPIEFNRAVR